MFKKVELLSKSEHKDLGFNQVDNFSFAKDIRLVSVGLSEVSKLASLLPIIISGGNEQQFVVFSALSNQDNYFSTNRCKDIYIPMSLRGYPFTMVDAYEENNNDRKFRAVAIDTGSEYVGEDKEHKIFEKEEKLSKFAQSKIQIIQNLEQDRLNAKRLIDELKKYDLLDKRSYEIKLEDGRSKSLLKDFYVVNKEKLLKLEKDILFKWIENGWFYTIESHINSINNINTLLVQLIKKDNK